MHLHVNCARAIGTNLNLDLLCAAQSGIVLNFAEPQLTKTASCQFANKWAERGYYNESNNVLCVK